MVMNKNRWLYPVLLAAFIISLYSCKKELNVGNPNQPTVQANASSETGIISLASGGVYINGFYNGDGWLGNSYFSLPYGYAELLGDMVTGEAANQLINQISLPDYALLDDGTKISNTAPSKTVMRLGNTRAQTGA